MKKRFLIMMLVLVMVVGLFPGMTLTEAVEASESLTIDKVELSYWDDNGTVDTSRICVKVFYTAEGIDYFSVMLTPPSGNFLNALYMGQENISEEGMFYFAVGKDQLVDTFGDALEGAEMMLKLTANTSMSASTTVVYHEPEGVVNKTPSFDWSGPCDTANTHTVDVGALLPADAEISEMQIIEGVGSPILSSVTPSWSTNQASLKFVTIAFDEPASDKVVLTVNTSNYDTFTVTINITLTGKYIVKISALPQDALYDGEAHSGYSNVSGTLTSGAAYEGDYAYTYAKADGTPLTEAPSEIGSYKVTIAVPADNAEYKGSLTLEFAITDEAEASYQAEASGEWKNGTFEEALENVYAGGTVKLLKDMILDETVAISKDITITSTDAENPCMITSETDGHGYLLNVSGAVTLENIIVDGGSGSNLTATRALIAVNGGTLTLGTGAIVRNNDNTTNQGIGGGVCLISGELVLDGGSLTGNKAYFGGGVGTVGGAFNAKNGEIKSNSASIGGGICVWHGGDASGTLNVSGPVTITQNSAQYYAGGIDCYITSNVSISGNPVISGNSSGEETDGGIYQDGNKNDGYPLVKIGDLTEGADVSFYTWLGEEDFVLAEPADGYSITADDLSKLSYNSADYSLKLNDSGKVVLAAPAATYSVIVENGTGSGEYSAGDTVAIKANAPESGKQFKEWTAAGAGVEFADSKSAETTFIMPANDVTLTAVYEDIPVSTAEVRYSTDGGSTWKEASLMAALWNCYNSQNVQIELLGDITLDSGWYAQQDLGYNGATWTIDGKGYTIQRSEGARMLFCVRYGSNVTLSNIIIDGGAVWDGDDPATRSNTGLSLEGTNAHLLYVDGGATLTLNEGVILQNSDLGASSYGAAIVVGYSDAGNGKLIMNEGVIIRNNRADSGGAILLMDSGDVFEMNGGTISGNYATSGGGAVCVSGGSFVMKGGQISGNASGNNGGGVTVNGTFTMEDGKITGNRSATGGGGVTALNGNVILQGGEISGNSITGSMGGGILVHNGTLAVSGNPVVGGNTINGTSVSNIYLNNKTISVSAPLTEGAEMGITTATAPSEGAPVNISGTNSTDYSKYFTSDNTGYTVINGEGNALLLSVPRTYTVTFDANGGSVTPASATTDASGSCQLSSLPVPSWSGYTFLGWFDAAEGGTEITTSTVFDKNTTIYAQWCEAYWTDAGNYDVSWYDPDESAYIISTGAELAGLAVLTNGLNGYEHVDFSYKQINLDSNIDLSAYLWTPIGSSSENLFTGTFYGANKTISGLRIKHTSDDFYVGLFGYATATLRDFHVVNAEVKNTGTGWHTGGIVGYLGTTSGYYASCMMMNCSFSGTVEGAEATGGLAGNINGAQILKCANYGDVTGGENTGGLVGLCYGWVDKSFNLGDVSGSNDVGGITGELGGRYSLKNSFNMGEISATAANANAGGIVGYEYNCTVSNCYYLDTACDAGVGSGSASAKAGAVAKSSTAFGSGEVAYLLNGEKTSGQAFFQNLDNGKPVDASPVFSGGTVYCGYVDCGDTEESYSNSPLRDDSEHSFDENGKCVYCGSQAVASLTKGEGEPTYYATLAAAVTAAGSCTEEEAAVLTLLDNIDLGENNQEINSGVFTLDLNGFKISSNAEDPAITLYSSNPCIVLTITDNSNEKSGLISGNYNAILSINSTVNILGGSFSAAYDAVDGYNSTVNISGGSFDGNRYDIYTSSANTVVALSLPAGGGDGASFPGGITVDGTTLKAILGEGAAYWQGEKMILPADDAKEITGGDVTIKKACDHSGNTNSGTDNGDGSHSITCSECGVEFITNEAHSFSFSAEQHVLSVSCEKCDMETVEISLVAPADLVYDGAAKVVTSSGSVPGLTLAAVAYCCEDGCTNVGRHTASLTMGEATAELSFEITAATPSLSWANASESLTYTGSPAAITAPVVTLVNGETYSGEINYSYTAAGETEEKAGLPTDVGSYSIKASIEAQGNYAAAESSNTLALTITAKPIAGADILVSGLEESYTYTGEAIKPEISVSVDGNTLSTDDYDVEYGENTTVAQGGSVTVTLKGNYSGERSLSFAIVPADQANFSILGASSATYGDAPVQLHTEGGSGDGSISWEITSGSAYASIDQTGLLSILGAGSVTVQASKAADGNYLAASDAHSIQIGRATAEAGDFSYSAPTDLVYSRSAKEATVSGKAGFGEITVKYYSDSEMSAEAEPINVGTYYVGITMAESDNYNAISVPMAMGSFTIIAKDLNVTANAQSRKYGEENPALTYAAPELIEGDSLSGSLATEATKDSDVGAYDITIGSLANSNYSIHFIGAKLTISQADGPIAPTVTGSYTNDGMTYTYTIDAIEDAEYSMDGDTWQDSNVFPGLAAGQKYTFYARIKENKNYKAGEIGRSAEVDLEKLPGMGSVSMEGWTYGEDAKAPVIESSTKNPVESYLYESTDGKGYSSAAVPANAGEYRLTVNFEATETHN